MPLKPGTLLGQYEIQELIGVGGMGKVYRAHDNKLKRDVALKVLPEAFARDPDRVARFRREAQVLASLNHPNIASIYNVEESGSVRFLVMELVLGETLRERIKRGPLPVEEAFDLCAQITEALEYAHGKPIIHRDLKPANVKVTPEGKVKVLDFGLAKAFVGDGPPVDPHDAPTGSLAGTLHGTILGTPAYMSPEQAGGKKADKRADIWAFGCVFYELVTGKQAFQGETVTEILASVLKAEPDWQALPQTTPANLLPLLRRCLQKDANRRFHSAADVRIEMEEGLTVPASTTTTSFLHLAHISRRRALLWSLPALLIGSLLTGLAVWQLKPSTSSGGGTAALRLTVTLPPGEQLGDLDTPSLALSPDGSKLVYVGRRGGTSQLYVRTLDSLETKPIPGTEGAQVPFFSPDGQWIGFFAQGKLKKVSVSGGSLQTLCDAGAPDGGSWGPDDTIFFAPANVSGLWKVSASGGQPQEVTKLDRSKGEFSHRWPQVLPGGRALLFTVVKGPGWDESQVVAQVLATGERHLLAQVGRMGRYVPSGRLVYWRTGTLLALPFDLARLEVTGSIPVTIVEGVMVTGTIFGPLGAQFEAASTGSLAYLPLAPHQYERRLVWVDRKGEVQPISAPPRAYLTPALSPDGRQIAVDIPSNTWDTWIYDLGRGTLTRLASEASSSQWPIWTPDGKRVTYRGTRAGFRNVHWKLADGTGSEERLSIGENVQDPFSWSPDGKVLAFVEQSPTSGLDIWTLRVEGDPGKPGQTGKPQVFLKTPFNEGGAQFSPDGRWLAYTSNESGRDEIYVQPFPGPGGKWQVSTEGGSEARWAPNGREIFYKNGDRMMVVEVNPTPSGFSGGRPRLLFEGKYLAGGFAGNYSVSPDGQRFLMIQSVEPEQPATQINVVLNWFEELRRKVPVTSGK